MRWSPFKFGGSVFSEASIIGVGIIVSDTEGKILLGERIKVGEGKTWSLPGGKIDRGECFEEAASRELAEETGIDLPAQQMKVLAMLMDYWSGQLRLTAAVLAPPSDEMPEVTEPHIFASWQRFLESSIPAVLFAPTAMVLAAWNPGRFAMPRGAYEYRLQ